MKQAGTTWPIAIGSDGSYVRVQDAKRGGLYKCPQCSAPFVARLGSIRAWHFAHYPGATCTGEGARHDMTKHMIAGALGTIKELPLHCGCSLLPTKPIPTEFTDARVEDVINEYRVDVTCRWKGALLCIEVVDTHPVPTDKKLALGKRLVEVDISRFTDGDVFRGEQMLALLKTELSCAIERLARSHVFIHTWTGKCWKCKRPRRVATVCGELWPDSLPREVLAALRRYTKIEFRRTSDVREGYYANVCPHCGTVQGDWYLNDERMEILCVNSDHGVETVFVPLSQTRPE